MPKVVLTRKQIDEERPRVSAVGSDDHIVYRGDNAKSQIRNDAGPPNRTVQAGDEHITREYLGASEFFELHVRNEARPLFFELSLSNVPSGQIPNSRVR